MEELLTYQSNFKEKVLRIFDSNVPQFFLAEEREPFEHFLNQQRSNYYLVKLKAEIIGAGGFCAESCDEARVCWLMIHSAYHKKGVGSRLMSSVEKKIIEEGKYKFISLKTAQTTEKFYQKLGYTTELFEKDHWAKGLDMYLMKKEIAR